MTAPHRPGPGQVDREIVRLALPALLALVAEPLFLLADAAIVGRLGTLPLAGLGLAAAIIQTIVGLCIFLAYGTTATVARRLGAGDLRAALTQGIDGTWLAIGIGVVATALALLLSGPLVAAFGAGPEVSAYALDYLRPALLGTTPVLVMLASTGVLRGLQDTRTPLIVAVGGNLANIVLNLLLVYGAGPVPALGIAGSALGSVLAQTGSAAALVWVLVRHSRRAGASLRPHLPGIRRAAAAGLPLIIRTLTLRAALLAGSYAAVLAGTTGAPGVTVATNQLAITWWTFLAFILDAIAIAAQALTGRSLGAGDRAHTRALTDRMIRWGWASGVVTGLALAAAAPLLGPLFTHDRAVLDLLTPVLLVAALGQPVAGVVFVLDGVLIGAGDGRYLAWAGLVMLAAYAPAVIVVALTTHSLIWVWVVLVAVFMGTRLAVLLARARGDAWLR